MDPKENKFQRRTPYPHVDERKDPVDKSPDKHHENSKYEHKKVVDGALDVPVHMSQQVVELWEDLCALVFMETLLKLQLERMRYAHRVKCWPLIGNTSQNNNHSAAVDMLGPVSRLLNTC